MNICLRIKILIKINNQNMMKNIQTLIKEKGCYFTYEQIKEISNWCRQSTFSSREIEKIWGNAILNKKNCKQWTTCLGEWFTKDILMLLGHTVNRPQQKKDIDKNLRPDLETEEAIYEVKTRNWNTPGTAGEKVLGVPFKYSSIPRLYNKPLRIILLGYQEHEYKKDLFEETTLEKKEFLEFYKKMNISYVKMTDLLDKLEL